ncbi:hypothetical protein MPTK1_8g09400 [Marchantia polymorpha subsp. ruderalis]|uniref:Uncharacterized protein n=1 Tax=Marchantia polymorpha TaxID=3197 RepID=A0A2R6W0I3_MARPO|nr:hypothetical protein MARPO_0204s0008 [Marchantia polymorpha]BBN19288.1 hypothetical protein Mp_8g09400 [Marchantia polymorpha subsp. ruderalis]|eukprot:PTQ27344.1 hypothetical protein MARPO_0204s0008 [Marchantia polymorpha]
MHVWLSHFNRGLLAAESLCKITRQFVDNSGIMYTCYEQIWLYFQSLVHYIRLTFGNLGNTSLSNEVFTGK